MSHTELTASLRDYRDRLHRGAIAEIDFSNLEHELLQAAECIDRLKAKAQSADKLWQLFRGDLLARVRAVAKLTGRPTALTEKLILSEQTTCDELLALKREIDSEFDNAFARTLTVSTPSTSDGAKLAEFKVGQG